MRTSLNKPKTFDQAMPWRLKGRGQSQSYETMSTSAES
jgi:hypothetical protein